MKEEDDEEEEAAAGEVAWHNRKRIVCAAQLSVGVNEYLKELKVLDIVVVVVVVVVACSLFALAYVHCTYGIQQCCADK